MADIDKLAEIIVNALELQGQKIERLAEAITNIEPPIVNIPEIPEFPETDLTETNELLKEISAKDKDIDVKIELV